MAQELTTLICLYHSRHHAQTAMEKIVAAGVPESSITMVGAEGSNVTASRETLTQMDVPEKDLQHLLDGITAGGAVLSVAALADHVDTVEDIFHKYANKIDEVDLDRTPAPLPVAAAVPAAAAGDAVIPIVEEEMVGRQGARWMPAAYASTGAIVEISGGRIGLATGRACQRRPAPCRPRRHGRRPAYPGRPRD